MSIRTLTIEHFRRCGISSICMATLTLAAPTSHGQAEGSGDTGKPAWVISPSISSSLTVTDNALPGQMQQPNVRLAQQGDTILSVTPAIRIDGKGGRVSGNLNFSWQRNQYVNESRYNNDQKSLSATGKGELIDQWLFLDSTATIAQSPTSVFSTQTVGNELANANRSETRSFQWSPYIRGVLGAGTDYELRYRNTQTRADTGVYATGSGVNSQAWSGKLAGVTPLALLGWTITAEDQRSKFDVWETRSNRLLGVLEYRFDPQLRFNLSTGTESDNFSTFNMRRRGVSGIGLDWAPTERTLLKLAKDQRSYGNGHTVEFSHRTALTAWKFSDNKTAVLPAQQFTNAAVSTAYDLLFLQLASSIPDPVARAQTVTALLQTQGIPADSLVYGNIMTAQPYLQRRQQASASLTGAHNTVTFTLQRSTSELIGSAIVSQDDFALSSYIRQSGFSASWAHKLTPDSSLTLNALSSLSKDDTATNDSRLRSLSLLYSTKLGDRTTASIGLRQNNYDSANPAAADYIEHAITGTLTASF